MQVKFTVAMVMLVIMAMPCLRSFGGMIVSFMSMVMRFERTAFTELQLRQAIRIAKRDNLCALAQRIDGLVEKGFHRRPDPEDHLGVLDCLGVGGLEAVDMLGTCPLHDQLRLAHPLHDRRHNRMERLDRYDDAFALCGKRYICGTGQKRRGEEEGAEMFHGLSLVGFMKDIIFK